MISRSDLDGSSRIQCGQAEVDQTHWLISRILSGCVPFEHFVQMLPWLVEVT